MRIVVWEACLNTPTPLKLTRTKAPSRAYFCELCQKGYARRDQLDTHENSYDHQHRARLQHTKEMMRTNFGSKTKTENQEMRPILDESTLKPQPQGSFKRSGFFKSAFAPAGGASATASGGVRKPAANTNLLVKEASAAGEEIPDGGMEVEEDGYW
ncbi:hypothetical protein LTR66_009589 [Elasticomyces elasticus]|nr:hypothetical protein LTR66_009589 [Elasticomyces elasticus]